MSCKLPKISSSDATNNNIVLNTTAAFSHRTPLPPTVTLDKALKVFRNHDILIRLDPEFASYETLPASIDTSKPSNPATKHYKVTDHMHTLPAGLWDTTVSFHADITDLDNGVEWMITAPLGLTQRSLWTVTKNEEPQEGEGEWVLTEDVEIKCSRLLIGTVKGKSEESWRGVHERFLGHVLSVEA